MRRSNRLFDLIAAVATIIAIAAAMVLLPW